MYSLCVRGAPILHRIQRKITRVSPKKIGNHHPNRPQIGRNSSRIVSRRPLRAIFGRLWSVERPFRAMLGRLGRSKEPVGAPVEATWVDLGSLGGPVGEVWSVWSAPLLIRIGIFFKNIFEIHYIDLIHSFFWIAEQLEPDPDSFRR